MAVEKLSRRYPEISLGNHRIYFDGSKGDPDNVRTIVPAHGERPKSTAQSKIVVSTMNKWYYHSDSVVNVVDNYIRDWFHVFLIHGTVWTGCCDNTAHQSHRLAVKPLKSADWPRDPLGPSWPSFPSIPEWMEMIRKGIDPFDRSELNQPEGDLGFTSVSRREISENHFLATKIVANYVVGIRSTAEVPGKFLKFFRYSQNFLILMSTWCLPIGLVRFLIAQWCQNPYSLWLRRAVTFKKFLKKVPIATVRRARTRLTRPDHGSEPILASGFTTPTEFESDCSSDDDSGLD